MDGDGFTYACMYACIYVYMYVIIIMAAMARWFSTTKHDLLTLYPCIGHNVGSLIVTMLVEMANPLLEKLCLKHYEFDLLTRFPSRSDNFFWLDFPALLTSFERHRLFHVISWDIIHGSQALQRCIPHLGIMHFFGKKYGNVRPHKSTDSAGSEFHGGNNIGSSSSLNMAAACKGWANARVCTQMQI